LKKQEEQAMKATLEQHYCTVTLEKGEKAPRTESLFWYRLRNLLRKQGHDVVRQVPAKDGHLTSASYYIRERKGAWAVYDNAHMLRFPHEELKNQGMVELWRLWVEIPRISQVKG